MGSVVLVTISIVMVTISVAIVTKSVSKIGKNVIIPLKNKKYLKCTKLIINALCIRNQIFSRILSGFRISNAYNSWNLTVLSVFFSVLVVFVCFHTKLRYLCWMCIQIGTSLLGIFHEGCRALGTKGTQGRDDRCGCSKILILDAEQNAYDMKISWFPMIFLQMTLLDLLILRNFRSKTAMSLSDFNRKIPKSIQKTGLPSFCSCFMQNR